MRMHSTDYERLSKRLGHHNEIKSLLVITEEGTERLLCDLAERDDLLARLND